MIIDDEQDARDLIRHYLSAYDHFEIIGEADNGMAAVEMIKELDPEVVFLDIQMPGLSGIEVLTHLERLPKIVFSTSFDQYAIKAFEIYAIDYLLKPYSKQRFAATMARLDHSRGQIQRFTEELLVQNRSYPEKVIVEKGRSKRLISVSDISYFEAFGDYSKVFTNKEEFLVTSGISTVHKKLNPTQFLRIHRSFLVNLEKVHELKKIDRYYYVFSPDFKPLRIGESYLSEIKSLFL
jgi:two-component system LytT family response regulator